MGSSKSMVKREGLAKQCSSLTEKPYWVGGLTDDVIMFLILIDLFYERMRTTKFIMIIGMGLAVTLRIKHGTRWLVLTGRFLSASFYSSSHSCGSSNGNTDPTYTPAPFTSAAFAGPRGRSLYGDSRYPLSRIHMNEPNACANRCGLECFNSSLVRLPNSMILW